MLDGASLDRPVVHTDDGTEFLAIMGWTIAGATRAVAVEIVHDRRIIAVGPMERPRPDVEIAHPGAVGVGGFRRNIPLSDLSPNFKLDLHAILEDGSRVGLGSVRGRHGEQPPSDDVRKPACDDEHRERSEALERLDGEVERLIATGLNGHELPPTDAALLEDLVLDDREVLLIGRGLGETARTVRARGARLVDVHEPDRLLTRLERLITSHRDVSRVFFFNETEDSSARSGDYDLVLAPPPGRSSTETPYSSHLEAQLKDILLDALGEQYSSVSPQGGIVTGNHYQSVTLGDTRTSGFRSDRERVLDRIDFTGRKVLDLGSNLGELSRAARERGARLVDGYEYDPFFVRVANLINALNGTTRVSFAERDIADPRTYDQPYDIVLAFAVFAYISEMVPNIAEIADVLVFETHKLDGDFEEHYIRPLSKHFAVHRVLAASDWGMESDPQAVRAAIVFAKDERVLRSVLRSGSDMGTQAPRPRASVAATRQLDVQRTSLQKTFFETFSFDTPADLVSTVDAMQLDVETISRSRDARELVYSGWVYWLLFLKGYLDYTKTGEQAAGNIFYDYLTRYYGATSGRTGDRGVRQLLDSPGEATEMVSRRFEDMERFRRGPADEAAAAHRTRAHLSQPAR